MPFRLFVPLPGPFVWTSRSRAERHYDRERRAARVAALSLEQRYWRFVGTVALLWAWGVWVAWSVFDSAGWALAIALVALWHLRRAPQHGRELRDEEDEAVAAELRRRGWVVDD